MKNSYKSGRSKPTKAQNKSKIIYGSPEAIQAVAPMHFGKVLLNILAALLNILAFVLSSASKTKPRTPSLMDIAMGEPMPFSDDYFIPDDKN